MTTFTAQDTKRMAKLAAIEIGDTNCDVLTAQVGSTLAWIEQIKEANTDGVEPLTNVHNSTLKTVPDVVSDGGITEDVLRNSEHAKYNYFAVPKVIE